MIVSSNSEREAAVDGFEVGVVCRAAQRTAREHCFLLLVETDRTELLPVADELIFDDDFMDGELALQALSAYFAEFHSILLTSRRDSIGT